jgi:STE24 endopeptidase
MANRFGRHMIRSRLQDLTCVRVLVVSFTAAAGVCLAGSAGAETWPAAASARLPAEITRYFTPQEFARGHAYATGAGWLFLAGLAVRIGVLLGLVLTPASAALRTWALTRTGGRPLRATALYMAVVVIGIALLRLPILYYSGFVREHAFQLSTETLVGWGVNWGKSLVLTLAMMLPLGCLLTALWRRAQRRWAVYACALCGIFAVVTVALAPLVLDPLFDPIRPLDDPALRQRILTLAERAGLHADQVYISEASHRTTAENAYFTGLGPTKRVVLYDTLLEHNDPEAVLAVVAHELGHWRHGDIWKGIGLSLLGLAVCFWCAARVLAWAGQGHRFHLSGPADIAALPLVMLVFAGLMLVSLPLQTAISRSFERAADQTSLELTHDPAAFIRSQVQLARADLADLAPSPLTVAFLYTHPPTVERIRMAERFAAGGTGHGGSPAAPKASAGP